MTEAAEAPREAAGEEKREGRSRRGRGNRRPREARQETAAGTGGAPHAVIENASAPAPSRFHAIIEIAGAPKAAPAPVVPAQQNLLLETSAAPLPGAVTASPAAILADLATSTASLQQVETQAAAASAAESSESSRPRRRRRPAAKPADTGPASLMQVETTAPVTANVTETAAPSVPHPTRRRTRPQVSEVQEPLVQVETQVK